MLEHHPALSVAVTDGQGRGAMASAKKGKLRLISGEFGIDAAFDQAEPLATLKRAPPAHLIALSAFSTTLAYLDAAGHRAEPVAIEMENSPIFGAKNEKSGLGSSAASTVALVAALMEANGYTLEKDRDLIHRIAQVSHSLGTGKVGSGFDIATSAFGTIQYVRFDKNAIGADFAMGYDEFKLKLKESVGREWPGMMAKPFSLSPYGIAAFNIRGRRTSTISSVKAVRKLIEHTPELYENMIGGQVEGERLVFESLVKRDRDGIREGMRQARAYQRMLSDWVGRVGMLNFDRIEPPELTKLIDAAEELPFVVAGRCPGSGGYDSVAFITEGKAGPQEIVKLGDKMGLRLEPLDIRISAEGAKRF